MEYSKEVLKKAKEAVEIGNAILEGKEIEWSLPSQCNWKTIYEPSLNFQTADYRVKPQPKYVPFTFEDAKYLIGKHIVNGYINAIVLETAEFGIKTASRHIRYDELLSCWEFNDGSRCGKLENK